MPEMLYTDDADLDTNAPEDEVEADEVAETTDEQPEWTPPTQEEFDKLQKALAKANREAKERREKLREIERSQDTDETGRKAQEAAEARYKPVAVRAAAKAAFLEAGLHGANGDKVGKLMKLLDMDAIDVDDDGEVEGLDDQVADLKRQFPEMFDGRRGPRAPRIDAGDKRPTDPKPKTSAERLAAQILGG